MSKTAEDNLRKINIERKKAGLRTFPITQERILKERKIMSKTKSKVSAMQASRDSLKSIEGMTKADKRSKKGGKTRSDTDFKKGGPSAPSRQTLSDQDIKKFAAKLHASIGAAMGAGSTLSALKAAINATKVKKQVPHRGTGPKPKAYGGKIKKRASGGRVKKSK